MLHPVQAACSSVIESSDEFLKAAKEVVLDPNGDDPWVIACFDIEELYPSIDQQHLRQQIDVTVHSSGIHSYKQRLLVLEMISIVVQNQQIQHKGECFLAILGLATGLAAGVFFANLYLVQQDIEILKQLINLNIHCKLYKRYIDDVCMIVKASSIERIATIANSWHRNIRWKLAAFGTDAIPFLDMSLSISSGRVSSKLYRKPSAIYQYIPAASCHPPSVFTGIAAGETNRILRRCSDSSDARKEIQFLRRKLEARGHRSFAISKAIAKVVRKLPANKGGSSSPHQNDSKKRKAFCILPWSSGMRAKWIRKVLLKNSAAIPAVHIMLAYSTQRNTFRKLYKSMWHA